jgi:polyisoprenoid-binding protein YceI
MYLITGNLTMLKATKELKIPARVTVGEKGLAVTAEFTIDRTQFGMSGFQNQVNKDVAMTVSIGQPTTKK